MKKLIRKIIIWAIQEHPKGLHQHQGIEAPANNYSKEDFEWHGHRLATLEDNMQLLMSHLNVRVVNKGKQIEEGQGSGNSEYLNQTGSIQRTVGSATKKRL